MTSDSTIRKIFDTYTPKITKYPVISYYKKLTPTELKKYNKTKPEWERIYYNTYTGKLSREKPKPEKDFYFIDKCDPDMRKSFFTAYFSEYLEEYDLVIVGKAKLDTRTSSIRKNKTRQWEIEKIYDHNRNSYHHYMIIDKDKNVWYRHYDQITRYKTYKTITPPVFFNRLNITDPDTIISINEEPYNEFIKPFLKLFPHVVNIGINKYVDITKSSYNMHDFLRYKDPEIKDSPSQKKINDLTAIPLPPLKIDINTKYKITKFDYFNQNNKYVNINKIKDNLCVIRTFQADEDKNILHEGARIYVSDKSITTCKPTNTGHWFRANLKSNPENWTYQLTNFNPDSVQNTKLEYFTELTENIPDVYKGYILIAMLQYPILEQLAKSGFKTFVANQLATMSSDPLYNIHKLLGVPKKKYTTIYSAFGLNKHQFNRVCDVAMLKDMPSYYLSDTQSKTIEKIDKYAHDNFYPKHNIISYIKTIYNDDYSEPFDIDHLDDKTFDILFDLFALVRATTNSVFYAETICIKYTNILRNLRTLYSPKTMINMIPKLKTLYKWISEDSGYYNYYREPIDRYADYLDMVKQIDDTTHFRPNFDTNDIKTTYEQIDNMHDAVMQIFNLKREAIEKENWEKLSPKWNKWKFETNDFLIKVPELPEEVAQEGIALHHCVKAYIPKILSGSTNILFLRKKETPDVPFFTIEISNDGTIHQIHGTCNRNIDTEPNCIPFIDEWIKTKKLKKSNINQVR